VRWALLLAAALVAFPWLVNDFWVLQVGGRSLAFGTVALSLIFLASRGGMLSLAQLAVAGVAGYTLAYFSAPMAGAGVALGFAVAVPLALVMATAFGLLVGVVAVRTEGIYTLMITLAIAMGVYYLALQNYALFNGFTGFTRVPAPMLAGIDLARPVPFFYLSLACAAGCYGLLRWITDTPFGLALQASRDNARRLQALGYRVAHIRIAAFALAGFVAGVGGILNTWLNGSMSPGSIALGPSINVLMAAVLGGLGAPEGAYLGALLFVLVQSFAIYVVRPERFNTVIGLVFIAVVVFSPDGVLGLRGALRSGIGRLRRYGAGRLPKLPLDIKTTLGNDHAG